MGPPSEHRSYVWHFQSLVGRIAWRQRVSSSGEAFGIAKSYRVVAVMIYEDELVPECSR
jgi:hypothetical protein